MANNIELLNREDAKDTKEKPPHPPRQFHYQKNQDFVGVVPRVPTPHQRRDPLALQRSGTDTEAPPLRKMKPPCPLGGNGGEKK